MTTASSAPTTVVGPTRSHAGGDTRSGSSADSSDVEVAQLVRSHLPVSIGEPVEQVVGAVRLRQQRRNVVRTPTR